MYKEDDDQEAEEPQTRMQRLEQNNAEIERLQKEFDRHQENIDREREQQQRYEQKMAKADGWANFWGNLAAGSFGIAGIGCGIMLLVPLLIFLWVIIETMFS